MGLDAQSNTREAWIDGIEPDDPSVQEVEFDATSEVVPRCTCLRVSETEIDSRGCELHKEISPNLHYDFRGEPPYPPGVILTTLGNTTDGWKP